MKPSTRVSTQRIKDFQLFSNPINTYIYSNKELSEEAGFLLPAGQEVLKTSWLELYNSGEFPDGSTEEYFVLPNVAQPEDGRKIYLIGKVLNSNTVNFNEGHAASMTFTSDDLDSDLNITFQHGIAHLNPIIQVIDNNNCICLPIAVLNSVGQTKIRIGRVISGTWKVVAYG
jgi:hypothetical protein